MFEKGPFLHVPFLNFVYILGIFPNYDKKLQDFCTFKVGLSPSKKVFFICFNDGPSKIMKNAFCFILKALFVLKVFKFLC